MTDLRKAAERALEALEDYRFASAFERPLAQDAIDELRQALAQTEKPPVKSYCGGKPNYCTPVDAVNMSQKPVDETVKREHEPVAWFIQYEYRHEFLWRKPNELEQKRALEIKPLYTAPPKKEWVGLTDDEVGAWPVWSPEIDAFVRNIEAKLKEKNT